MPDRRRGHRGVVRALFAVLLTLPVLLSTFAGIPSTRADDYRQDIKDAMDQQKKLQQQITDQTQTLGELRQAEARLQTAISLTDDRLTSIGADLTDLRQEIADAEAELKIVQARYAALVAQLQHLDWTLGVLQTQLQQAEQDLDARRRLLAQRLADAYRVQQTSLLEQIITSDSFSDVLAEVGSHLRFGDQDAELAAQIGRDQASLETLRKTTAATRYKTDQVRMEVRRQQLQIEAQRAKLLLAKKRLEELEAQTKRLQAQQLAAYHKVIKTQAQAEALLDLTQTASVKLKGQIAALIEQQKLYGNIPSTYNGTFQWPLKGTITQEFGCTHFPWEPPLGSCDHFHRGIDMVAPEGTEITAAGDGVIVFIGYNPYDNPADPAWIVLIAHSSDLITWYGHLQPIIPPGIKQGMKVKAGTVIGYEGNTGNSTGPHLHWGVQLSGSFVNPRLFV